MVPSSVQTKFWDNDFLFAELPVLNDVHNSIAIEASFGVFLGRFSNFCFLMREGLNDRVKAPYRVEANMADNADGAPVQSDDLSARREADFAVAPARDMTVNRGLVDGAPVILSL